MSECTDRQHLSFANIIKHFRPCFGSGAGSGLDQDFNQVSGSGSGSRRAKMIKKMGKIKKFHILKSWMFYFEG